MFVRRLQLLTVTSLALIAATGARAADYTPPPPPPVYVQPPPSEPCCDNWYLRGQIGAGMLKASLTYTTQTDAILQHSSNADTYFVGGGIGYEWNNWLRFDATAEYRAKSRVYAFVTYPPSGIDEYQGNISSWVMLANAYVDLGTWNCFTPFVGVGIGGAYNTLSDLSDVNPNGGYGFGHNPSSWSLAWALHAGVAYNVSKNFKVELAYRYLNYGSISDTIDCSVTCTHDELKYKLTSQDIMLGFRWTCCELPAPPAPPPQYVYAPPPVYTPPPAYTPPPLRSRG
jgi:opacity protein-like surface antigen